MPRPRLREPHPVRPLAVLVGVIGAGAWLTVFSLLGTDLSSYLWWTLGGGALSGVAAAILARYGDRGVAVGVAAATGVALSAAALSILTEWIRTSTWPL